MADTRSGHRGNPNAGYTRKRADRRKGTWRTSGRDAAGLEAQAGGPRLTAQTLNQGPAATQQRTADMMAAQTWTPDPMFGASPQPGINGGGLTGTTGGANKQDFSNEYYWASPEFAVGKAMQGLGMSTDVNSSFSNAMQSLAPGLKWMSLLAGGDPAGGISSFGSNVAGWMGAGDNGGNDAGYGGMGQLATGLGTLLNGGAGNIALEGYIDAMDPRQMLAAIGQMAQTAGYGQVAPELLQGLSGVMENAYQNFGINGGELLANLAPGQSDMDVFRNYFQDTGNDILNYFGSLGF